MGRKKVVKEFDSLPEDERPVFPISVVAQMYNIHQQSLRMYERAELLTPKRTSGNTRMYSRKDLQQLEIILNLSQELGVNLAGIEIILRLRKEISNTQQVRDRALIEIEKMLGFIRDKLGDDFNIPEMNVTNLGSQLMNIDQSNAIVPVSKRGITKRKP